MPLEYSWPCPALCLVGRQRRARSGPRGEGAGRAGRATALLPRARGYRRACSAPRLARCRPGERLLRPAGLRGAPVRMPCAPRVLGASRFAGSAAPVQSPAVPLLPTLPRARGPGKIYKAMPLSHYVRDERTVTSQPPGASLASQRPGSLANAGRSSRGQGAPASVHGLRGQRRVCSSEHTQT